MNEALVTRTIKVGQHLGMNSSQAYLGISVGHVIVKSIHDLPALDADCMKSALTFLEAETSSMDETEQADEILETTRHYMDQPWVEYRYTYFKGQRIAFQDTQQSEYLPLDLFASHTTMY